MQGRRELQLSAARLFRLSVDHDALTCAVNVIDIEHTHAFAQVKNNRVRRDTPSTQPPHNDERAQSERLRPRDTRTTSHSARDLNTRDERDRPRDRSDHSEGTTCHSHERARALAQLRPQLLPDHVSL